MLKHLKDFRPAADAATQTGESRQSQSILENPDGQEKIGIAIQNDCVTPYSAVKYKDSRCLDRMLQKTLVNVNKRFGENTRTLLHMAADRTLSRCC